MVCFFEISEFHPEIRTCCNASNHDWDEFMKIPGCCTGHHSVIKMERPQITRSDPPPDQIRHETVLNHPVSQPLPGAVTTEQDLIPFMTKDGLLKCCNAGCMKEYMESENLDGVCKYHAGKAGFRDTRKFWTCCEASSYDWDEFMKIQTCCVGKHEPKMVARPT